MAVQNNLGGDFPITTFGFSMLCHFLQNGGHVCRAAAQRSLRHVDSEKIRPFLERLPVAQVEKVEALFQGTLSQAAKSVIGVQRENDFYILNQLLADLETKIFCAPPSLQAAVFESFFGSRQTQSSSFKAHISLEHMSFAQPNEFQRVIEVAKEAIRSQAMQDVRSTLRHYFFPYPASATRAGMYRCLSFSEKESFIRDGLEDFSGQLDQLEKKCINSAIGASEDVEMRFACLKALRERHIRDMRASFFLLVRSSSSQEEQMRKRLSSIDKAIAQVERVVSGVEWAVPKNSCRNFDVLVLLFDRYIDSLFREIAPPEGQTICIYVEDDLMMAERIAVALKKQLPTVSLQISTNESRFSEQEVQQRMWELEIRAPVVPIRSVPDSVLVIAKRIPFMFFGTEPPFHSNALYIKSCSDSVRKPEEVYLENQQIIFKDLCLDRLHEKVTRALWACHPQLEGRLSVINKEIQHLIGQDRVHVFYDAEEQYPLFVSRVSSPIVSLKEEISEIRAKMRRSMPWRL